MIMIMVMIIVIYVIVMIVSLIVGNFWCSSSSGCFDFVVIILNITLVMSFFFDIVNSTPFFKTLSLSLYIYIYIFFFLLGSDPATQLMRFARDIRGSTCQLDMISLGRGREARTEETITKSFRHRGRWVFLQNCHLASSFMPRLKEIVRR